MLSDNESLRPGTLGEGRADAEGIRHSSYQLLCLMPHRAVHGMPKFGLGMARGELHTQREADSDLTYTGYIPNGDCKQCSLNWGLPLFSLCIHTPPDGYQEGTRAAHPAADRN